jgi:cytochrome c-type biogenesis protein CcmH/NrfG
MRWAMKKAAVPSILVALALLAVAVILATAVDRGAYGIVGNEQIDAPVSDLSPPRIHQINKHEHNENEYQLQKTKY